MKSGKNSAVAEMPIPKCVYKIRLVVGDMERSLKFYSEFLGIRIAWIEKEDTGKVQVTALELHDLEIVLVGPEHGHSFTPDTQCGKGISLYLEVEDIQEWFARSQRYGYTPLSPVSLRPIRRPVKRPGGETAFALVDPDGYDIRISLLW